MILTGPDGFVTIKKNKCLNPVCTIKKYILHIAIVL